MDLCKLVWAHADPLDHERGSQPSKLAHLPAGRTRAGARTWSPDYSYTSPSDHPSAEGAGMDPGGHMSVRLMCVAVPANRFSSIL